MRRHLAWRVLLPIGLGVLVVVLAILQYHWLGQVGAAERADMHHSLERRAQDFAAEVDNELGMLRAAFASLDDGPDRDLAAALATHLAAWKQRDRYPDLVRALYVIATHTPREAVLRFDESRRDFVSVSTPPEIAPVFDRLSFSGTVSSEARQPYTQVAVFGGSPFVSAVPAELIWLRDEDALPPSPPLRLPLRANVLMHAPAGDRALIVQLDRTLLAEKMLPEMLARHFGERPPEGHPPPGPIPGLVAPRLFERGFVVRLQVVDAENEVIVTAGMMPGESMSPEQADVTTPILVSHVEPGGQGDVRVQMRQDSWQLLVQHGAGSLDRAVALTRQRNLYTSFGILAVLVVAMGLVVGNAQRSQRLAAQQMEFVATVSHELRTPVAVIRSAAENLASGIVQEPARAKQYGELIESEGRRLTDMIEHVLEHAHIHDASRSTPRRVDVDVRELIGDTVRACEPMVAGAGMTLDVALAADLPRLMADAPALRQALENLIANAVKHAAAGGWIGVAARLASPHHRDMLRDCRRGGPTHARPVRVIEIAVSDHGPGVGSSERELIFDAFYRGRVALDRQVRGSGLGLSLVKRIVEDHGGRVEVRATPGGGSTFSVRLPVLPDPAVLAVDAHA